MGYYATQRAEIKAQLEAVSGIGKVYVTQKNPTEEATFKSLYSSNGIINVCMISRSVGVELENGIGVLDEKEELQFVQKEDEWEITLLYGYNDDDTTPSETTFNNLVDAIETKFRFLAGLNSACYRSFPLQRIQSGIFSFLNNLVLCHKVVWNLKLQERVESTESES